jgi:hypothetical protein
VPGAGMMVNNPITRSITFKFAKKVLDDPHPRRIDTKKTDGNRGGFLSFRNKNLEPHIHLSKSISAYCGAAVIKAAEPLETKIPAKRG